MGSIEYGGHRFGFEDRLLAHLQIVIVNKLRANEGFLMSWVNSVAIGSGRTSIWLHPANPVRFHFDQDRAPVIDPDWVRALRHTADAPTGLLVLNQDGTVAHCGDSL